jgi:hypothetical protein
MRFSAELIQDAAYFGYSLLVFLGMLISMIVIVTFRKSRKDDDFRPIGEESEPIEPRRSPFGGPRG